MRQQARLIMDTGEEVRVEVETDDLDRDEFVLYRVDPVEPPRRETPPSDDPRPA
ncbi:MAG: hypothetical protein JOZ64_11700 [Solirubrobacterales bacterium]|nr:hypothetical protein [Solirubrobacterales bacterium]